MFAGKLYICNRIPCLCGGFVHAKTSIFNKQNISVMSNRKSLKKKINNICADLFAECVATSLYTGRPRKEDVDAILELIISVNDDYVRRVSHPEPGLPARKYFKVIREAFDKQVIEIIDQIGNLN